MEEIVWDFQNNNISTERTASYRSRRNREIPYVTRHYPLDVLNIYIQGEAVGR